MISKVPRRSLLLAPTQLFSAGYRDGMYGRTYHPHTMPFYRSKQR